MTLDQLLTEIETRELEFKEKPNPALYKTLSAFSNFSKNAASHLSPNFCIQSLPHAADPQKPE